MAIDSLDFQKDVLREFRKMKRRAEAAVSQISEEEFFKALDENSNSIGLIIKHLSGNMHSRWRDFLSTDGEKLDRQRDQEFVHDSGDSKESLMRSWEDGWQLLFDAVSALESADISGRVSIRQEPHTVVQALTRELIHYAGHVGQIIYMAKHLAGDGWKSLTIPRGRSEDFKIATKPYLSED